MIKLENIVKDFGTPKKPVRVLHNINLDIQEGDFISVMGPSGSGKSTLSSIVACLSVPTSGKFFFKGMEISKLGDNQLAKLRNRYIGFVFQEFNLLQGLSALENVMLPMYYAGVSTAKAKERARACLAIVGLSDRMNYQIPQLSGGQKQRVAIARALVNEPPLIFADEPTGALDPETGLIIMGILQKLNLLGHTIVQVTHSLEHSLFAKRIITIAQGQVISDAINGEQRFAPGTIDLKEADSVKGSLWGIVQKLSPAKFADLPNLEATLRREPYTSQSVVVACQHNLFTEADIQSVMDHRDWQVAIKLLEHGKLLRDQDLWTKILLAAIQHTHPWIRYIALKQVSVSSPWIQKALLPSILNMLKDPDHRNRALTISCVGKIGPEHIEEVRVLLKDPDGRVRANALEELARLCSDRSFLKEYLEDPYPRTRANAIVGYKDASFDEAFHALRNMVALEQTNWKISGAWACGFFGQKGFELLMQLIPQVKDVNILKTAISRAASLVDKHGEVAWVLGPIEALLSKE